MHQVSLEKVYKDQLVLFWSKLLEFFSLHRGYLFPAESGGKSPNEDCPPNLGKSDREVKMLVGFKSVLGLKMAIIWSLSFYFSHTFSTTYTTKVESNWSTFWSETLLTGRLVKELSGVKLWVGVIESLSLYFGVSSTNELSSSDLNFILINLNKQTSHFIINQSYFWKLSSDLEGVSDLSMFTLERRIISDSKGVSALKDSGNPIDSIRLARDLCAVCILEKKCVRYCNHFLVQ